MKKYLLLVTLLICTQWTNLFAQQNLFDLPSDTICVRQPIRLQSNVTASTYYWGFCSGYLLNPVAATNMGSGFGLSTPSAVDIMKDGDNYYGFALNNATNELSRLSYGTSLSNTPTVTNLGTLEGNIPVSPNKMYLMKDSNNYFMFVTGGTDATNSTIARVDFGKSLASTPNSVNFGNLNGFFNKPTGIFVGKDGSNYYGYVINEVDNKLIRLTFGGNVSLTPVETDLGNFGGTFSAVTDMAGIYDNGFWYLFAVNSFSNSLVRVDFGNTLANNPAIINYGDLNATLSTPTAITIARDCDLIHAYITNSNSGEIVEVKIPALASLTYTSTIQTQTAGTNNIPTDISRVIRERDNLYAFVSNSGDNSLTKLLFSQCTNSSIQSSQASPTDSFYYDTAGYYNIYLAINEGLPNHQVQCKQIRVIPIPAISLSPELFICQHDTTTLVAQSTDAISYTWSPDYNITNTTGITVYAYPQYTTKYRLVMPFPSGCVVDTYVVVNVWKNNADAGPDRMISDGAGAMLGGPLTTVSPEHSYTWFPNQYVESQYNPSTRVTPATDFTYYLMVQDTNGCKDIDTVVVRVNCDGINLPNAFSPNSGNGNTNTFGLLNNQIIQLNYFKIFDRWGKEVFSTTDPTKRWDGTINGEPAPLAVYVWEADGFCQNKQRFKRSGNVTLMR